MPAPTVDQYGINNITSPLPISGGTNGYIYGSNFDNPTVTDVFIDGNSVSFNVSNDTTIQFTIPSQSVGTYTLRVENADGFSETDVDYVSYPIASHASYADPSGSGSFFIYGANFNNGFTVVSIEIDSTPLGPGDFAVDNDNQLTINSYPALSPGAYQVRVENDDGGWWLTVSNFLTYTNYPSDFAQVDPNTGGTGDTVIAYYYGFTGVTSVEFGSTPATSFIIIDDERLEVVVPSMSAGTYNFVTDVVTFNGAFTHTGGGGGGGDPHFIGFDGVPFDFQGTENETPVWYNLYQDPVTTIYASFRKPDDVWMSFIDQIRVEYIKDGEKKKAHIGTEDSIGFLVATSDPEVVLKESLPKDMAEGWLEKVDTELFSIETDSVRLKVSRGVHVPNTGSSNHKYLNVNVKLLRFHKDTTGFLGQTLKAQNDRQSPESFAVVLTNDEGEI